MENDDQESTRAHEDEMNKLRVAAASPSPSALSTASSGSPLVRGSSATSGKRPAPTSIAAAQLQCQQQQQQQQQLEFTNRLMGAKRSHGKHGSRGSSSSSSTRHDWTLEENKRVSSPGFEAKTLSSSSTTLGQIAKKAAKGQQSNGDGLKTNDDSSSCNKNGSGSDHNKSFGYNVAKSIAFRAYRFNEFWSVNKMRYMNLACLLMTLICLVTILLFTGGNSSSTNTVTTIKLISEPTSSSSGIRRNQQQQQQAAAEGESLDSLNSQPLVSSGSSNVAVTTQQPSHHQMNSNKASSIQSAINGDFDDFNLFDERQTKDNNKSSARRKLLQEPHTQSAASTSEREVEETTTTNTLNQPAPVTEPNENWPPGDRWPAPFRFGGGSESGGASRSILDPILSQIFQDMELGNLFKPLRRLAATSGSNNNSHGPTIMMMKPVIRRSKNGATIVISGSSTFSNDLPINSTNNDSMSLQLPSLIEKLLPPMLRPLSLSASSSSGGSSSPMMMMMMMKPSQTAQSEATNNSATASSGPLATITFGGPEPVLTSASSSSPLSARLNPFAGSGEPFFSGAASSQQQQQLHSSRSGSDLFMEPLGVRNMFRLPFGPMFMPPPPPPPSLISMLMRQATSDSADDEPMGPFHTMSRSPHNNPFQMAPLFASSISVNNDNNKDSRQQLKMNDTHQSGQPAASQNSSSSSPSSRHSIDTNANSELDSMDSAPIHRMPSPSHLNHAHHPFYPRPMQRTSSSSSNGPQGSMLIFSSSSSSGNGADQANGGSGRGLSEPALQMQPNFMGPFMGMIPPISPFPAPHMVLLGSSSTGDGPSSGVGPLNPILRSILNNAMSDLAPFHSAPSTADMMANRSSSHQNQVKASSTPSNQNYQKSGGSAASSSVMTPSWSSGAPQQSSIDPDDEWTDIGNERWDEQTQSKHLRARHRDVDSDLTEATGLDGATEFVTGLQLDQQAQGNNQPLMESIRQTIRGPGLTVERIIEVPASSSSSANHHHRLHQNNVVAPGIKSQSLSRNPADSFDDNEQQQHSRGAHLLPLGGSLFSRNSMDSRSDEPPVGFIGRLLSDLTSRSRNEQSPNARMGRGRALLDEDLDEGDSTGSDESMQRPPMNWPPKMSVRHGIRPMQMDSSSGQEKGSPLSMRWVPAHITIPEPAESSLNELRESSFDSFIGQHQQPSSELNNGNQQKLSSTPASLKDTLNSMEDRLNHALSMATASSKQHDDEDSSTQNNDNKSSRSSSQVTGSAQSDAIRQQLSNGDQLPQLQPRGIIPHHHSLQNQKVNQQQSTDNPYTSPSSPLFGFPASSSSSSSASQSSSNLLQQDQAKVKQQATSSNNNSQQQQQPGSNRQQRSFTYHSNHELAIPFSSNTKLTTTAAAATSSSSNTQTALAQAESMARARFLAPAFAPANVVMGRRIDDQPPTIFGGSEISSSHTAPTQQSMDGIGNSEGLMMMRNQQQAAASQFAPSQAASSMQQAMNSNSNFRTIVV